MLRTVLFVVAGLAFAGVATADVLKKFNVGGWEVRALAFEGTKRFSHCAAGAPYNSGLAVFFVVTREYQWAIGFYSERFGFETGRAIKLALALDDDPPTTVTGHTMSRDAVRVDLAPTTELFNKFRRGGSLRLIGSDRSYTFNLTDTSKVLPALVQCVNSALSPTPMQTAQQQAARARSTSTTLARAKDNRAEATAIVANLLSQAGVSGFQISPAGQDGITAIGDAVWTAGNVSGALIIVENDPTLKAAGDTAPQLIAITAASCKGLVRCFAG
jgi:hypothetical protein